MGKYCKIIMIFGLLAVIAGCATVSRQTNHDRDYLKQTRSVAPTRVPPGLSAAGAQSYYPIPPITLGPVKNVVPLQPSILPPGSEAATQQAQKFNNPPAPAPASIVTASSSTSLVLGTDYNHSWDKVGQGLRASGYKVMQQDKSVGGFFIVNEAETGGQLTANTPIYQVHLTPSGNSTTVTILNDKNQPASPAVSSRVLGALRSKL